MSMKQDLRKMIREKRKHISQEFIKSNSQKIKTRLFLTDEYIKAVTILIYVSYDAEVSTHEMIKESIIDGKTMIVPKSLLRSNSLLLSHLKEWDELEPGAYNILEPKSEFIREVNEDILDLVIVPGVAFDCFGNRLGHGKGYYDRLLKKIHNIPIIGLAFEFQILNMIETEEHDEKIDLIITEERIINCKR